MAAVIRRADADLTPGETVDHIAGFMRLCDWSARDLQAAETRILPGDIICSGTVGTGCILELSQ